MRTVLTAGMFTGLLDASAVARASERMVMVMLCTFLLLVCLIAVGVVAVKPRRRRAVLDGVGPAAGPVASGDVSASDRNRQTLEGVVTRQLVTGEITGPQYRHAMASIASRDAERHPFELPSEVDPPDAA